MQTSLTKGFLRTLRIVVMPKMSPTMTHGKILKMWLSPQQVVGSYDKIMEVSTATLLDTSSEAAVMEIEVMEDMHVAAVFAKEGQQLEVGRPVALLCDHPADITEAQSIKVNLPHSEARCVTYSGCFCSDTSSVQCVLGQYISHRHWCGKYSDSYLAGIR
jgi:hypothetical protein